MSVRRKIRNHKEVHFNHAKTTLLTCLAIAALAICLPIDVFAQTTSDFASQDFVDTATRIQNFLFGIPMRLAGAFGAVYGAIRAFFTHSMTPLLILGGIGLTINLVPLFLDSVFNVSGILIP